MFKKISLSILAFLQATALVVYIFAVVSLIQYLGDNLPQEDTVLSSIAALLLFTTSAVVSGLIVLGRAGQLWMAKKPRPAFKLIGWTVAWMGGYLFVVLAFLLST